MADASSPRAYLTGGWSQVPRAIQGRKVYKTQRGMWENYQNILAANRRSYEVADQAQRDEFARQTQEKRRQAAIDALEKGFADPNRTAGRDAIYDSELNNEVQNLKYGYDNSTKATSLEAVRRGRLGSSTDAEKQAGLKNALNTGLVNAEGSASDRRTAISDLDDRQLQQLRRALLAGDPQAEQIYRGQAQGTSQEIDRILQGGAREQRDRELRAQAEYDRYSAWGGLANAGASGVYSAYGNPQYTY
jgi:hypothetical protein